MNAYEQRHAKRYALSLEAVRPYLCAGAKILELGGSSAFGKKLAALPDLSLRVDFTSSDLRHPWPSLQKGEASQSDIALCMEVIEHIHDRETKPFATEWMGTGTANLLEETFRLLKPGGLLFLTTPNAASLNVLYKALMQEPPMIYRPHVREYAPHELAALVQAAGFERITVTSHDCWDNDCVPPADLALLRSVIGRLGYRTDCRGEDLFLTAFKPASK